MLQEVTYVMEVLVDKSINQIDTTSYALLLTILQFIHNAPRNILHPIYVKTVKSCIENTDSMQI